MISALATGRAPEPPPLPRLGAGVHSGPQGGYLSWQGQVTIATALGTLSFARKKAPSSSELDHNPN